MMVPDCRRRLTVAHADLLQLLVSSIQLLCATNLEQTARKQLKQRSFKLGLKTHLFRVTLEP